MDDNSKRALVKARITLEKADGIKVSDQRCFADFESLITMYNELADLVGDSKIIPRVPEFNYSIDTKADSLHLKWLSDDGKKKLNLIHAKCKEFVDLDDMNDTQESSLSNSKQAVNGWNSNHVIGIVSIIITAIIAIAVYLAQYSYQRGIADGKAEVSHEYDAEKVNLQKNIETLEIKLKSINDSLKNCQSTSSK